MKSLIDRLPLNAGTESRIETLLCHRNASCLHVAIAGGHTMRFNGTADGCLVHLIRGEMHCWVNTPAHACYLTAGGVATFPPGDLWLAGDEFSQAIIIVPHPSGVSPMWPMQLLPNIQDIPPSKRPGDIVLREVWSALQMPTGIGYEYFRIGLPDPDMTVPEIVEAPKHSHADSTSIVVILRGKGEVFIDGQWWPITENDVITIPAGMVHAFRGNFVAVSIQTSPIGDDYVFTA